VKWPSRKKILYAVIVAVLVCVASVIMFRQNRDKNNDLDVVDPAVQERITKQDSEILKTKIAMLFPDWAASAKSGHARFTSAALQLDVVESIDSSFVTHEDNAQVLADASLRSLIAPDGLRYLEFSGATDNLEPDSELSMVDVPRQERRRLLFYGPSTRFDDAAWVDNDTIAVVGSGSDEDVQDPRKRSVQPLVWIVHLSANVVSMYAEKAP